MSNSDSMGQISRDSARLLLGETQGRTVSAVISDGFAGFWEDLTGHRPARTEVMPLIHLPMVGLGLYAVSRRPADPA